MGGDGRGCFENVFRCLFGQSRRGALTRGAVSLAMAAPFEQVIGNFVCSAEPSDLCVGATLINDR
jgi:hypothetical protein